MLVSATKTASLAKQPLSIYEVQPDGKNDTSIPAKNRGSQPILAKLTSSTCSISRVILGDFQKTVGNAWKPLNLDVTFNQSSHKKNQIVSSAMSHS